MRRRKSLGRKIINWFFIGYLPPFFILCIDEWITTKNFISNSYFLLTAPIIMSPFFYFGILYCVKTHKEIVGLFKQANWIQKLILGIFAFLTFGRIIRVIIQTFKQS